MSNLRMKAVASDGEKIPVANQQNFDFSDIKTGAWSSRAVDESNMNRPKMDRMSISVKDSDMLQDYNRAFDDVSYNGNNETMANIEDTMYDESSAWGNSAKVLGQFAAKTAIQVGGNITGAGYGLTAWAATGDRSKFYDNDFTDLTDSMTSWAEDEMGIYKPKDFDERGFFKGSGTLFAESVADALAFTAGAAISEMATGGLASLAIANKVGRMFRLANSAKKASQLASGADKFNKVARAAQKWKTVNDVGRIARQTFLNGAAWEGIVETKGAMEELRHTLESKGLNEEEINSRIHDAEAKVFFANVAIVQASNMIQFPNLFKSPSAMRLSSIGKEFKGAKDFLKTTVKNGKLSAKYQDMSKLALTGKIFKNTLKNPISEGMEEMSQGVVSTAVNRAYGSGSGTEDVSITDALGALGDGFWKSTMTVAGRHEAYMGMLIGMIGSPSVRKNNKDKNEKERAKNIMSWTGLSWEGSSINRMFEYRKDQKTAKEMAAELDGLRLPKYNIDKLRSLQDTQASLNGIENSDNDINSEDLYDDAVVGFFKPFVKYGYTDIAHSMIDDVSDMKGDEFIDAVMDSDSAIKYKTELRDSLEDSTNDEAYNEKANELRDNTIKSLRGSIKNYSIAQSKADKSGITNAYSRDKYAYYLYKMDSFKSMIEDKVKTIRNAFDSAIAENPGLSDILNTVDENGLNLIDKFISEENNFEIEDAFNMSLNSAGFVDEEKRRELMSELGNYMTSSSSVFKQVIGILDSKKSGYSKQEAESVVDAFKELKVAKIGLHNAINLSNQLFADPAFYATEKAKVDLKAIEEEAKQFASMDFKDEQGITEWKEGLLNRAKLISENFSKDMNLDKFNELLEQSEKAATRMLDAKREVAKEHSKIKNSKPDKSVKNTKKKTNVTSPVNKNEKSKDISTSGTSENSHLKAMSLATTESKSSEGDYNEYVSKLEDLGEDVDSENVTTSVDIIPVSTEGKSMETIPDLDYSGNTPNDPKAMEEAAKKFNFGLKAVVTTTIKSGKNKGKKVVFKTFAYNVINESRDTSDNQSVRNIYKELSDKMNEKGVKDKDVKVTFNNTSVFESINKIKEKESRGDRNLLNAVDNLGENESERIGNLIEKLLVYSDMNLDYSKMSKGKGKSGVELSQILKKLKAKDHSSGRIYFTGKTASGRLLPIKLNHNSLNDTHPELAGIVAEIMFNIALGNNNDGKVLSAMRDNVINKLGLNADLINSKTKLYELLDMFVNSGEQTLIDGNKKKLATFSKTKAVIIGDTSYKFNENSGKVTNNSGQVVGIDVIKAALINADIKTNVRFDVIRNEGSYEKDSYAAFVINNVLSTDIADNVEFIPEEDSVGLSPIMTTKINIHKEAKRESSKNKTTSGSGAFENTLGRKSKMKASQQSIALRSLREASSLDEKSANINRIIELSHDKEFKRKFFNLAKSKQDVDSIITELEDAGYEKNKDGYYVKKGKSKVVKKAKEKSDNNYSTIAEFNKAKLTFKIDAKEDEDGKITYTTSFRKSRKTRKSFNDLSEAIKWGVEMHNEKAITIKPPKNTDIIETKEDEITEPLVEDNLYEFPQNITFDDNLSKEDIIKEVDSMIAEINGDKYDVISTGKNAQKVNTGRTSNYISLKINGVNGSIMAKSEFGKIQLQKIQDALNEMNECKK